jgi:murein DD-endopeptidase MepM/ murein hydrolase activator NlpD
MLDKLKTPFIVVITAALAFWIGDTMYRYFTHQKKPILFVKGLEQDGSYRGVMECVLSANNDYKIAEARVFLDGKKLDIGVSKIRARKFDYPFSIDTTELTHEKHSLEIEAVDGSYHRNTALFKWDFYVDNVPLKAAFIESAFRVEQGKTIHIKIQANKKLKKAQVSFLSVNYECYPESKISTTYECFIPIDCEQATMQGLTINADLEDGVRSSVKLTAQAEILAGQFKKQRGEIAVNSQKFNEEKEMSISPKVLDEAIMRWTQDSPKEKLWVGPFEFPINVRRMTTPFGEVRMTPERGRYMHKGIDLVDLPKSIVWASQHGKVIIKDRFTMTGNTIVIDHGLGVSTLYAHLENFAEVEVGDMVKKGNPIGRIGMTGYASGYHLHWELRVNGTPVDPLEWTNKIY